MKIFDLTLVIPLGQKLKFILVSDSLRFKGGITNTPEALRMAADYIVRGPNNR